MERKATTAKELILDQAMAALGIDHRMKTDPEIIKAVLAEMKLDDLKTDFAPMKRFFHEAITFPQSLQILFDNIKAGIVHKHPAIIDFAELALDKKWLAPSEHVQYATHVTYILEAVTAAMCNNHNFFVDVQDHLRAKERKYGLNSRSIIGSFIRCLRTTHSFFDTLKALSVDPYMLYFRMSRGLGRLQFNKKELLEFSKANKLNYIEYKLLCPERKRSLSHTLELLEINIYEAGLTEYEAGFKTNSISAFELNEDILKNPPVCEFYETNILPKHATGSFYQSIASQGNLFPRFNFSEKWSSLYTTWNLAFVIGNLEELDIVLPKLLIPSLLDAEHQNFLGIRGISLWLTMNTFLFRKCDGTVDVLGPSNKTEMAQAWAKINKRYAVDLAKREVHESSRTLTRHYNQIFSRPIRNFLRLLRHFLS